MMFRITVFLSIFMILNSFIETSESVDTSQGRQNIKEEIHKLIQNKEKVEQAHFNELADIELARLQAIHIKNIPPSGYGYSSRAKAIYDMGLSPYGPVYDELRFHGSHDLTEPKQKIKNDIESLQFSGRKAKQEHFDYLARREATTLQKQEFENLMADGYKAKLAQALAEQRAVELYERLREPTINLRTGSALPIDLSNPKKRIKYQIKKMKDSGNTIMQDHYDNLAMRETDALRNRYMRELAEAGLSEGTIHKLMLERGLLTADGVYHELRKPSTPLETGEHSNQWWKHMRSGEGSSSTSKK